MAILGSEDVRAMTVLTMSAAEIFRFDTLMRLDRGEIRVADAMTLLNLERRQIYRLLERLRTLAREYLAERHGLRVSCETLRQMMIAAGLWKDREARRPRPYEPRYRRDCRGELIQVDGSKHWWFEDRGPQCTLLVYIDDATSELMRLEMVESESTFSYMRATRTYIERHGKPVALYSDKHSAFRNNTASANGDGMTHLGRALHALNVEIICANSPQAKGRVKRANGTLQDRLVKAMRLEGISTIDQANAFLPFYMIRHNRQFAKVPFDPRDLHRPLAPHENIEAEMVWREERTVTASLTQHLNDNKHLDAALAMARLIQETTPHHRKRNNNEPARTAQRAGLFAPAAPPSATKVDRRTLCTPKPKRGPRLPNEEFVARGLAECAS